VPTTAITVDLRPDAPETVDAELLGVPFSGSLSPLATRLDAALHGQLSGLVASGEARSDSGATALLHVGPDRPVDARRVALVGVGDAGELDDDGVRTAAAAAVRLAKRIGGTVAFAYDPDLGLDDARQRCSADTPPAAGRRQARSCAPIAS